MDFAANFTAIDFETASRRSDSACQLGLVTVREGRMVDQACWLIRPKPLYFHRANIAIHGITPNQVRNEPEFGELWPEIAEKIGSDCLVAHNASFDLRVLIESLRAHDQPIPELLFTCTRAIARRTWPHHRRYGLKPLSTWLGIRFQHHDALEDAIACAKILLAAGIDREAESLPDLEKRLRLRRGKAGEWGLRGPTGPSRRRPANATPSAAGRSGLPFWLPNQRLDGQTGRGPTKIGEHSAADHTSAEIDVQRLMIRAEFIRPLAGKQVVLSGRFRILSQEDAQSLAVRSGATCQERIDDATDYLVMGSDDNRQRTGQPGESSRPEEAAGGHPSLSDPAELRNVELGDAGLRDAGLRDAELRDLVSQLRDGGHPIRLVSEDEFIGLVGSPATSR